MSTKAQSRRRKPPPPPQSSTTNGEGRHEEEEEEEEKGPQIGVLDVVRAITPLLIIIVLALGMLVAGYLFVPETLSTAFFGGSSSVSSSPLSSTPSPHTPSTKDTNCEALSSVKSLITALKDFSRWKELGSALGLHPQLLHTIEQDDKETELKKRAMLRAWYSRETAADDGNGACWTPILEALVGLGESSLAQDIASANDVHWPSS